MITVLREHSSAPPLTTQCSLVRKRQKLKATKPPVLFAPPPPPFPPPPLNLRLMSLGEAVQREEEMESSHEFCRTTKDVSLLELRDRLAEFARVRGWEQYHSPRNLLLALVGEVGELSEIFQWKGEVARGLPNWTADDKTHLEEELSDVLLYLVQLADVCGLDLGQAALSKIIKNAQKYPVANQTSSTTFN